jgi:hypothetical protein
LCWFFEPRDEFEEALRIVVRTGPRHGAGPKMRETALCPHRELPGEGRIFS